MISNPDLIHYACSVQGTTVIAEFNSNAAALAAAKCLGKTPVRSQTYTFYAFMINDPLVYFAIFDKRLETSEGFVFLKSACSAFRGFFAEGSQRKLEKLASNCFQGEFNHVFQQLLAPAPYHMEWFGSVPG